LLERMKATPLGVVGGTVTTSPATRVVVADVVLVVLGEPDGPCPGR
jgi:hypothetical protein